MTKYVCQTIFNFELFQLADLFSFVTLRLSFCDLITCLFLRSSGSIWDPVQNNTYKIILELNESWSTFINGDISIVKGSTWTESTFHLGPHLGALWVLLRLVTIRVDWCRPNGVLWVIHGLSKVEVDNSELLILSPLLRSDHLAEIMVPYQDSQE